MIEIDSLDDTCSNMSGQSSQLFPDTGSQEASILRRLNEKTPLFTYWVFSSFKSFTVAHTSQNYFGFKHPQRSQKKYQVDYFSCGDEVFRRFFSNRS